MSGKKIFGLVLLLIGASALLGLLGFHIGGLVGLVIGVLLIVYGIKQWRAGRTFWGGLITVLGALILLGSLPSLFSLLIGAALVYFGYKLLTNSDDHHTPPSPPPKQDFTDPFDDEWEKVMKSADL